MAGLPGRRFSLIVLAAMAVVFASSVPLITSLTVMKEFGDEFDAPTIGLRPVATVEVVKSVSTIFQGVCPYTYSGDRNEPLEMNADRYLLDKHGQIAIGPSVRDVTITVHCDVDASILLRNLGSILVRVAKVSITDSKIEFQTSHSVGSVTVMMTPAASRSGIEDDSSNAVDESSRTVNLVLHIVESPTSL